MKFSLRIKTWVLAVALVPLLLSMVFSVWRSINTLDGLNEDRLVSIREIKAAQLTGLFERIQKGLEVVTDVAGMHINELDNPEIHKLFTGINTHLQFYDIFIIRPDGLVQYTVAREADYRSNLKSGPYANSGLGKMFHRIQQSSAELVMEDFAPYAPSNNHPAAFMGRPMMVDGQKWVVAIQIPLDRINALMNLREGMGQSGETYLVGSDYRMRSDSYLDPKGHSVQASFAGTVDQNGVDSDAVKDALAGNTSVAYIIDYNGNSVLSAYAPFEMFGVKWAILAEIDEAEIKAPIRTSISSNGVIVLLATALAVVAAFLVTKAVMGPLGGEPVEMNAIAARVAEGDLSFQMEQGEPGSLKANLKTMLDNLRQLLQGIKDSSEQLSAASVELSAVTEDAERNLTQQNTQLVEAVAAVNQMASSIGEVADSASGAATDSRKASDDCHQGLTKVKQTSHQVNALEEEVVKSHQGVLSLVESTKAITSVLDVIRGVAEQTNLLALNAAIEAARAGENGRGFAVVADEVRNLAHRSQESTVQIEKMISTIQSQIGLTVDAMEKSKERVSHTHQAAMEAGQAIEQVLEAVKALTDQSIRVSSATEQQAVTANSVNGNLLTIRDIATQTISGANQTSASSAELARLASGLSNMVEEFRL
ncbi:methyl-accepting chemotaxis protein [Aliiglaciecola sp. CAU 1673]|uniref:methyl-accepting chemotaxis protein n=1 Tax=Aliiglaciecola sp. CAU 1673 TaxID=3032595 RepID=UPI0023DBD00E|nr:methyl-accepting chemotaxis protein [Aliiglaciecola sp. CAU 1673]MDF2176930.1 methyl-accepting chemotaxis protein [Aliiglaciecola sp. CAU 1673]